MILGSQPRYVKAIPVVGLVSIPTCQPDGFSPR